MTQNHRRGMMMAAITGAFVVVPADAGLLSMRFAGGSSETTLSPSQSATIEVCFQLGPFEKAVHRLTRFEARFDVGSLTPGVGGQYVVEDQSPLTVTSAASGTIPNWNSTGTSGVGGGFDSSFFLTAGDPNGVSGPLPGHTGAPAVIGTFTVRLDAPTAGDVFAVFRVNDSLPALHNGATLWSNRFGSNIVIGPQQFELGMGNPGDADPRWAYHGFETLQPLVIHTVPEPGAMALLLVAVFVAAWRRRAPLDETGG